jgi:hypothetical protein
MSGLRLLDWKRVDKGALVGRAAVLLPSGLQISDIGIFENGNGRGAQLPAEMMRDAAGNQWRTLAPETRATSRCCDGAAAMRRKNSRLS